MQMIIIWSLGIGLVILGGLRICLSFQQRALRRSISDELDELRAARLRERVND